MAKILLVDDEADIRTMLRDSLLLNGHEVALAESAEMAVELAKENAFDIAVIDYVLPGTRGLDLLRQLQKISPFLKSIIVSGQIDHDTLNANDLERELKERIAADRYLPKPVAGPDLLDEIGIFHAGYFERSLIQFDGGGAPGQQVKESWGIRHVHLNARIASDWINWLCS